MLVDVAVEDVGHAAEQTFTINVPVMQLCTNTSTPKVLVNWS